MTGSRTALPATVAVLTLGLLAAASGVLSPLRHLGWHGPAFAWAVVLLLRGRSRGEGRKLLEEAVEGWRAAPLPVAVTAQALLLALAFSLVPPVAFDAMVYHLEVPARFLEAGAVVPIAENLCSNVPLMGEMLDAFGLGLEGTDLAQLLSWVVFLLVLALFCVWARLVLGAEAAAWGAARVATLPAVLVLVSHAGTDWITTLFTLGVVLLLAAGGREPGRMAAAGLLAGAAASSKDPALGFAILLPALAVTFLWQGGGLAAALGSAGFTHILFNPGELERLARPGTAWVPPPQGEEGLKAFMGTRTRKVFESGGVFVLQVRRG